MEVTIFRDVKSTDQPFYKHVSVVFNRIKEGSSKEIVLKVRAEKDKKKRNEIKKELPSICFSGKFKKRADESIINHSGLICLDFDGFKNHKEMISFRTRLMKDRYVMSVFTSPSGDGLKCIVKIPQDIDRHKNFFYALQKHFSSQHFDVTSSNISRVCYESYDPMIYINMDSAVWTDQGEIEYRKVDREKDPVTIPVTDESKIMKRLISWWEKEYPMVPGQRNHHAFILAAAFNDFGVNKTMCEYILGEYEDPDFTMTEIKRTIDSAYSDTSKHGSKYFEDTEKVYDVNRRYREGESKKDIRHQLEETGVDGDIVDAILQRLEQSSKSNKFWSSNDKGIIKIDPFAFKNFLEDNGYYRYVREGAKEYTFVKVTSNLIDTVNGFDIKDFILEYLIDRGEIRVYNHFAESLWYFGHSFLGLLSTIDVFFIEDTKDTAYLYYRNCALKITTKGVQPIDYIDLGGYVWKEQVIDRDYKEKYRTTCDYMRFIANVSGGNKDRIKSVESTIGYLLHGFNSLRYNPAVILNDEVISDNPEGGTGKGIFVNAISKMKKVVAIDGKMFQPDKTFAYQLVSADTQIISFDDVKKNFDFERLFSVITEGVTIEKKNMDAVKVPFSKSPKIVITTNYAIRGAGNSFERRKWELEFHRYYRKDFTPADEFGRMLFNDWDDDEWAAFDGYMISCLVGYLNTGLVQSSFVNLKIRQLSAETCHEFIEWCGLVDNNKPSNIFSSFEKGSKLYKHDLYNDFVTEYPDFAPKAKRSISRILFNKWLVSYCMYKEGVAPEEGRDQQRWIRLRRRSELEYTGNIFNQ